MTQDKFVKVINKEIEYCRTLLTSKGVEYAKDNADRLHAFKRAAALEGTSPEAALFGMYAKHLVSVAMMCNDDTAYPEEVWKEKITDSINYNLLLYALVMEETEK